MARLARSIAGGTFYFSNDALCRERHAAVRWEAANEKKKARWFNGGLDVQLPPGQHKCHGHVAEMPGTHRDEQGAKACSRRPR
jgi:hypothetical protein